MHSVLNLSNDTTHCGNLGHALDDPLAICEVAAEHGFASINLDLTTSQAWDLAAVSRRMSGLGLRPATFGFTVALFGMDAEFEESLPEFEAQAQRARSLGFQTALCYIPPFSNDLSFSALFNRTVARLRACRGLLDRHDLKVGFEFIGPTETRRETRHDFIHTMDGVRALIAAAGLEGRGGFKLDVHHWQTSGAGPLDLHHLEAGDILYVELNDGLPGYDRFTMPEFERELPLSTGITHIRSFMQSLRQLGYTGPVAVEPWNTRLQQAPLSQAVAEVKAALDACLGNGEQSDGR